MKKYYVIILLTILIGFIIQLTQQPKETEWIESCYGYDCIDRAEPTEPRKDWGYSSNYCKVIEFTNAENGEKFLKTNCLV